MVEWTKVLRCESVQDCVVSVCRCGLSVSSEVGACEGIESVISLVKAEQALPVECAITVLINMSSADEQLAADIVDLDVIPAFIQALSFQLVTHRRRRTFRGAQGDLPLDGQRGVASSFIHALSFQLVQSLSSHHRIISSYIYSTSVKVTRMYNKSVCYFKQCSGYDV